EERDDQVRTALHSPGTKGLTEVLVVLLQAHVFGYVEETEKTEGGVEDQATGIDPGVMQLALQQVVGQVADIADIAEYVMHAVFEELRRNGPVPLRHRLQRIGIESVVEAEHGTVEAFPRVVFRSGLTHGRQKAQANEGHQAAQAREPASTDHMH